MHDFLNAYRDRVTDLTGQLSLSQLVELIAHCDGLVAASTGPLHLAAAFGIRAVGLYAPSGQFSRSAGLRSGKMRAIWFLTRSAVIAGIRVIAIVSAALLRKW